MHAMVRCGIVLMGVVVLTGCEGMGTAAQSKTVQGAALGSALGAATGAIVGNQSDHAGAGTAIGAGLGAIGGGLIGNAMEEQDRQSQRASMPVASSNTKVCPIGGELYQEDIQYCPVHGAQLRAQTP